MTNANRIVSALASVRTANGTAEMLQRNEFLLSADEVAKEISGMRVELSVAAAHLAYVLDPANQPVAVLRPLKLSRP